MGRFGGDIYWKCCRQVVDSSYQTWSYAMLISYYNASVQEGMASIFPCAYLYNYRRQDPLGAEQYEIYLEDAPAFTRGEVSKLRDFIKKRIWIVDNKELIYNIHSKRIKPSKSLQDFIAKMLRETVKLSCWMNSRLFTKKS